MAWVGDFLPATLAIHFYMLIRALLYLRTPMEKQIRSFSKILHRLLIRLGINIAEQPETLIHTLLKTLVQRGEISFAVERHFLLQGCWAMESLNGVVA